MHAPSVEIVETSIRFGGARRPIRAFKLFSGRLSATIWDHGATLVAVETPDGSNFVQARGPDSDFGAEDRGGFMGSTIGRYANRIANARFDLDGAEYHLVANDGPHTLHGGPVGFDRRAWVAEVLERPDRVGVRCSLQSEDGDQGFPGNLSVSVTFWLEPNDRLVLEYEATCDAPTVVSLTNHAYWNLAGVGTIGDHALEINAGAYLEADETLIPVAVKSVAGTPYDFRSARAIIDENAGAGLDTCFVLNPTDPAAVLTHVPSGRRMTIETDQPGLQVYTANRLIPRHRGVALEAQALPDSPNRPDFPPVVLRPGATYRQTTTHRFEY